jgi:hypothetical protein
MGVNKIFVANVVIAQRRTHTDFQMNSLLKVWAVFDERHRARTVLWCTRLLRAKGCIGQRGVCNAHGCANLEKLLLAHEPHGGSFVFVPALVL